MSDRRSFLKKAVATAAAVGVSPSAAIADRPATAPTRRTRRAGAPLNILILGGTGFTGPEQVNYALARGHKITLLNRNRRRPDLFKGKVDMLVGDLNGDVSTLRGKKFDVVIDNPTTNPAWVRNVAQFLAGNVGQYIFISTLSVYPDNSEPGKDETAPLTPLPEAIAADPYAVPQADWGRYYGALKTHSEREAERHYPGRTTIIRPGLIVGPLDSSERFTYWPARIDRGGEVLAPGNPTDPVQFVDSRDLAEWTIRMAENKTFGTFNATGPAHPLSIAEMLYGIKAVTTAGAQFTWVPAEFLARHSVRPWQQMPVWINPVGGSAGFAQRSNARAIAAGLTFRPLATTAKDTLDWHKTRPEAERTAQLNATRGFGISPAKEAEVLAAWRASRK